MSTGQFALELDAPARTSYRPAAAVRPGDVVQIRDQSDAPLWTETVVSTSTRWRRGTYAAPCRRSYYTRRTVLVTNGYRGHGTWLAPHATIEVLRDAPSAPPRRQPRRRRFHASR